MICINELSDQKCRNYNVIESFTILLSPYAPHISEEIWQKLGKNNSITKAKFPKFNLEFLQENDVNYPVSFNGKTRFKITLPVEMSREDIQAEVMRHEKTQHYLSGKSPKKIIVVPKRIVNIVF